MNIEKNLFPGARLRALTFSYDDGVNHDLRLMEIFRRHNISATFNISCGWLSPEDGRRESGPLTWNLKAGDISKEYQGFEVAAHGWGHPRYELMPDAQAAMDMLRGRGELETLIQRPVRGMAYPYGSYRRDVTPALLNYCGITYCRTTLSTHHFSLPEDFLLWCPTCHHDDPALFRLCDDFLAPGNQNALRLFYIWGHSYEFERNDNWDRIETLCARLAGHEDVWYATNIEIYDYVQAVERLVSSCDGTMLFNPSAMDVWVRADGKPVRVPAGKEIKLS